MVKNYMKLVHALIDSFRGSSKSRKFYTLRHENHEEQGIHGYEPINPNYRIGAATRKRQLKKWLRHICGMAKILENLDPYVPRVYMCTFQMCCSLYTYTTSRYQTILNTFFGESLNPSFTLSSLTCGLFKLGSCFYKAIED